MKEGLQIRELRRGDEGEFIAIEIWSTERIIKVINFKQLEGETLGRSMGRTKQEGDLVWGFECAQYSLGIQR